MTKRRSWHGGLLSAGMTALQIGYRVARITEPDFDMLPGIGIDVPDVVGLGGGEHREGTVTGVRALLLALLEDSIRCYLSPKAKLRSDAERWIEGRVQNAAVPFEDVCASFGLEPTATRKMLRRLRHRCMLPKHLGRVRPNVRHTSALSLRRRRSRAQPSCTRAAAD